MSPTATNNLVEENKSCNLLVNGPREQLDVCKVEVSRTYDGLRNGGLLEGPLEREVSPSEQMGVSISILTLSFAADILN